MIMIFFRVASIFVAIFVGFNINTKDITIEVDTPTRDLYPIDAIAAVIIDGPHENEVVTFSDIERPGLGGEIRTFEEVVFEWLIYLDAKKHHIAPEDEAVEQYLVSIQRDNNLTSSQLEQVFTASGYTMAEGREMLKKVQAVNMMLDFRVRSKMIVSRKEVEEYYHNNPEYDDASYCLSRAVIHFSDEKDKKKKKKWIKKIIKEGKSKKHFDWGSSFWIKESEMSLDRADLFTDLVIDGVVFAGEVESGFELFYLNDKKEKQLLSLEDRYYDIVAILQKPKFEQLMDQYKDTLQKNTTVIYFDKE